MIIVTGGAGFIGSNIVKALNAHAIDDILVVDDLTDGHKYVNLADLNIADYIDKDEFLTRVETNQDFGRSVQGIFHQGACSATTEWDGRYLMQNNYEYSKTLLHYAQEKRIPFLYASSAATYGGGKIFQELRQFEQPLNVYGYSKSLFDQYVRRHLEKADSQIVGLRYFNVYGPREQDKGSMASVAFHFTNQIRETGVCRLFEGSNGYADGEQLRDFVYIVDAVNVNLWFFDNPGLSGIFNCGTGHAQSFNDVARAVIAREGCGEIEYIPFPENLRGAYQSYTQADLGKLRSVGFDQEFRSVAEGVNDYFLD